MDTVAPTDWSQVKDFVTEGEARYAMDNKLYVQFYLRPILQTKMSEEAGRPIYKDVAHIRIIVPGDKLSIVDRIASDDDKKRFGSHWAAFQKGQETQVIGTRLEAVPFMTRSKVEEYKFFGIHTVEQLAEASDSVGQKFPGFMADREKSKKFLEATQGNDARIKELEQKLEAMMAERQAEQAAKKVPEVAVKK